MDDQQGNVIDGTARARQWRLARSPARAESDGAEARSDAPKSIAGSLLVPADMLSIGVPDDETGGGAHSVRRRYRLLLRSPSNMCRRTARLTRTRSSFRTQAAPRTRVSPRARVFGQSPDCSPARLLGGYADVTGTLMSV